MNEFFAEIVRREVPGVDPVVEAYITDLLIRFMRTDQLFALRDSAGVRLQTLNEMLPEGDVAQNAQSFERERQVHRHIGDFLLFWSGLFPEYIAKEVDEPARQGKESYHLVSLFDMPPHDREAPIFRELSDDFEEYAFALRGIRREIGGSFGWA
ncbi:MAG: hypothetical protein JNK63_08475 [Chthonomonas sp.]|nr:hypothetical protein [Chthonomonas sp.]